jgi:non-ribosomal peptide synthetase component F
VQSFRGSYEPVVVPAALTAGLKELSRREGVTLFMTLLAGFQTLLYRLSGQEDIVVGTGIANRNRDAVEGLIGFFVNTLALRTDLGGNPSFRELLGRVREVTLGAYAHQDVPFEKLVEELEPERALGHTPLFQVMFSLQNTPTQTLELPGLKLERFSTTAGTAHLGLILTMQESQEEIAGIVEYDTDIFDEITITRILNHFTLLLEGAAAHPDWHLIDLPLSLGDEDSGWHEVASVLESNDQEEQFSFQQ